MATLKFTKIKESDKKNYNLLTATGDKTYDILLESNLELPCDAEQRKHYKIIQSIGWDSVNKMLNSDVLDKIYLKHDFEEDEIHMLFKIKRYETY